MGNADKRPLISVIVPIYKVEPYLRKCIDSILSQTYTNLEIILVDDGSPDNCPSICDDYAHKDERVHVIHKSNGGLSDARNAGMEIATGDWLSFIDSDDWIEPHMYETLLQIANENDAQISVGGVINEQITEQGTIVTNTTAGSDIVIKARETKSAICHFFENTWAAWDKIYRREVFDGVRFPIGEINEDEAIALHLLEKCERVAYTNEAFYHYISRPESITTSSFSSKKFAWYRHCRDNLAQIRKRHPDLVLPALLRYRSSLLWTLTEVALADTPYPTELRDMLTELRGNCKLFSTAPYTSKKERIRFLMLRYLPFSLYRAFIRFKRNI